MEWKKEIRKTVIDDSVRGNDWAMAMAMAE